MFITFTYRCPSCGHQEDRLVKRSEMDEQTCLQDTCEGRRRIRLIRLPSAPRTTFRFADRRLKK